MDLTVPASETGPTALPTRRLGQSGLALPVLGIGCSVLGNRGKPMLEGEAAAMLTQALAAGANYFDTAPYYGFGLSERRVGDALRPAARDSFILSTKVGRRLEPAPDLDVSVPRHGFASPMPFQPVFDYSYDGVMRSYEASLARLGLARIDILLIHDIGRFAHGEAHPALFRQLMDGGYRALDQLRAGGAIKAFGLGVNECAVCEQAMDHGDFDGFLLAGRYTLLEQGALDSLLPRCAARGASIILGGPYNSGLLAGGTRREGALRYDYGPAPVEIVDRLRRIEAVCDAYAVPIAAAALQFPLGHPVVASVIPGIGSVERLHQTLTLMQAPIAPGFWAALKAEDLLRSDAPTPDLLTSAL